MEISAVFYMQIGSFDRMVWLPIFGSVVCIPIVFLVYMFVVLDPNPEMLAAAKDAACRKFRKQFYSRGRRFVCF